MTPTNNVSLNIEQVKNDVSDIRSHAKHLDLKFEAVELKLDLLLEVFPEKKA